MSNDLISTFWSKFYFLILVFALLLSLFILNIIFRKKIYKKDEFYNIKFFPPIFILLILLHFFGRDLVLFASDLKYIGNKSYIEVSAKVVRFDDSKGPFIICGRCSDDIYMDDPVFYIPSIDEEICLFRGDNDVDLNKYYLIRYWPNTKYFCVVE